MATPTGFTGSTATDADYTSDGEILYRIAQMRANRGFAPSPVWDNVWLERIKRGDATLGDVRDALEQRAIRESDPNWTPPPEGESDPQPIGWTGDTPSDADLTSPDDIRDRVAAMRANRGLAPSPMWDNVWVERIMAGEATLGDARDALEQAAVRESGQPSPAQPTPPGAPGPGDPGGGGAPGAPVDDPDATFNYRDFAPAWLDGELLDLFVDSWASTGDPALAMETVRRSNAYDSVFAGNRRDDGSLRYTEEQYFSVVESFQRAAAEFGLAPPPPKHERPSRGDGGIRTEGPSGRRLPDVEDARRLRQPTLREPQPRSGVDRPDPNLEQFNLPRERR